LSEDQESSSTFNGKRLKLLRQSNGLSRREIAEGLGVDISAVAAWENGRYSPRDKHLKNLASVLDVDVSELFSTAPDSSCAENSVALFDTIKDMPQLMLDLLGRTNRTLKDLRIAAPYGTPTHVHKEFRAKISERILNDTLEVQRVEIFYSLDRLAEVLSNIFRYDGRPYWVKAYCTGVSEVVPGVGGYFFDDEYFLLGAYWTGIPPQNRPSLHLSGEAFSIFFKEYWDEIWRRGTLLNPRGKHGLDAVRTCALQLGLPAENWDGFVEQARNFEVGDLHPPRI